MADGIVIYVDVDDTFVRTFGSKRIAITPMIEHIRALANAGTELYCWSSGGSDYARVSATEFGIADCFRAFLPKPQAMIDDQLIADWRGLLQLHPNECGGESLNRYAGVTPMPPSLLGIDNPRVVPTVLTRIGLIGDVHAQDDLLEIAIGHLAGLGLDAILCTGDVVDGAGDAERCVDLMTKAGVLSVRGNHDRWVVQDGSAVQSASGHTDLTATVRMQLRLLPPTRSFDTPAGRLLLCHGLGQNDLRELRRGDTVDDVAANVELQQLRASDYALVIAGHTHEPMVLDYDGVVVINAGTLRADRDPVFATVDFDLRVVQFYGVDDVGVVGVREMYRF